MNFDKLFQKQSRLVKVILLLIPIVNYVTEILVRISAVMRKSSAINIAGAILFIVPWGIATAYIDLIWAIIFDKLFLYE